MKPLFQGFFNCQKVRVEKVMEMLIKPVVELFYKSFGYLYNCIKTIRFYAFYAVFYMFFEYFLMF